MRMRIGVINLSMLLPALAVAIVLLLIYRQPVAAADKPLEIVSVQRIWDKAPHNAFTDLIRFNDRWWCVFREGQKHVAEDGALRVIVSVDGETWESAALLQSDVEDLRDGKLSITPDGRLMLLGEGAHSSPPPAYHQTYAWFSSDGKIWSDPVPVGERNYWLWRVTWSQGVGYGIAYATNGAPKAMRLYRTNDGVHFTPLVNSIFTGGYPNESSMLFLANGTALTLLRRDPVSGMSSSISDAQLGVAQPPYTDWQWMNVGRRIGGPNMIELPDKRILAAVRLHDGAVRTSLCWVNPQTGGLTEAVALPSGGDTSYAGMVWHDGMLWVSYYSSHESKTSIYLAKLRIELNQISEMSK